MFLVLIGGMHCHVFFDGARASYRSMSSIHTTKYTGPNMIDVHMSDVI